MIFKLSDSINQQIILPNNTVELYIKREDKIHPFVSGNKYRKLKYNLLEAKNNGFDTLLTFGGAFSNHIAAVASAGNAFGFKTIGIVRGQELGSKISENSTLSFAKENGMQFKFVSRELYRNKTSESFLNDLKEEFGDFYLISEGGTNKLAVKGCEEILTEEDRIYDVICTAVGTGGTISGIINASKKHQTVIGFPALKGDFLQKDIEHLINTFRWANK